jgi:hypothetical protein
MVEAKVLWRHFGLETEEINMADRRVTSLLRL